MTRGSSELGYGLLGFAIVLVVLGVVWVLPHTAVGPEPWEVTAAHVAADSARADSLMQLAERLDSLTVRGLRDSVTAATWQRAYVAMKRQRDIAAGLPVDVQPRRGESLP
jgi:hypothetical protein